MLIQEYKQWLMCIAVLHVPDSQYPYPKLYRNAGGGFELFCQDHLTKRPQSGYAGKR